MKNHVFTLVLLLAAATAFLAIQAADGKIITRLVQKQ